MAPEAANSPSSQKQNFAGPENKHGREEREEDADVTTLRLCPCRVPSPVVGYNRFFKVEDLLSEGYLDPKNDSVTLLFHVRALNYCQHSRDQARYIEAMRGGPVHSPSPSRTVHTPSPSRTTLLSTLQRARACHEHAVRVCIARGAHGARSAPRFFVLSISSCVCQQAQG